MPTANDYLGLGLDAARDQWRAIIARKPVLEGRQVDFTPVETLLCLAASLVVNHRKYGGSTAHRAEEPVPSLAKLFRRPNSSILAKMANLDGSRRNGAKHEIEVSARLLGTPGLLSETYVLLLKAARDVGIAVDNLPDFLSLEEDSGDLLLLGQDELVESDLEAAVEDTVVSWVQSQSHLDERLTQRLLVAAARIGQHRFATEVLRNHGHRCVFCGLAVRVGGKRAQQMLIASHIKPWRVSNSAERLDPSNGLTACPTHDVAFDTGLITINGGLRIHLHPQLEQAATDDDAARAAFGRPPLKDRLLLPVDAPAPGAGYLAWHRTNVYRHPLGVGHAQRDCGKPLPE